MSAVTPEQGHWLGNFILNSGLRAKMDNDKRQTLFNFLRRTQAAFREYEEARQLTLAHLTDQRPNAISGYIKAIDHWGTVPVTGRPDVGRALQRPKDPVRQR
jgi:hypothetical protein